VLWFFSQLPLLSFSVMYSPWRCLFLFLLPTAIVTQSSIYDVTNYTLTQTGDPNSVVYDTSGTHANVSVTNPPPDVFLNASVLVGEIDLTVTNLTAKINLDAEVRSLLQFNAGVTAQIDRVSLVIQNITAYAHLEARLENLVSMIGDVLNSLDLNPVLATLGHDVSSLAGSALGGLSNPAVSPPKTVKRADLAARATTLLDSFALQDNILYSINDYEGNTHTNRVLFQNGDIVDEALDNDGVVLSHTVVGSVAADMAFNGYNKTVTLAGQSVHELEYTYSPLVGLSIVAAVFQDLSGMTVAARILAESRAGGYSTIE
jgi:hypothetical protein